jgi:uncharacterized membrane protein
MNTITSEATTTLELLKRRARAGAFRSVINQAHDNQATFGERLADRIASGIGSWRFLIIQTVLVAAWVTANVWLLKHPFDPFPLILLNLLFSVQAAYTGPVLLLAGNRQSQKDRLTLEHAADEAERADRQDMEILSEIKRNTEITVRILQHFDQHVEQAEQQATTD